MGIIVTGSVSSQDAEFAAMQTLYGALEPLDDDARARVVDYIVSRLEIIVARQRSSSPVLGVESNVDDAAIEEESGVAPKFASFAELYEAAQPKTKSDKALVAGYWLQVCNDADSFDAQSANKELKHLGEGLANVTSAIDGLKTQKPALALQLKKGGKTRQARKVYKITVAGIKAVEAMIHG